MNPLLKSAKASSGERTSINFTRADITGLMTLAHAECTAADDTGTSATGASTINRHVLQKLIDHNLAFISSTPFTIERARITELGREVLRKLEAASR